MAPPRASDTTSALAARFAPGEDPRIGLCGPVTLERLNVTLLALPEVLDIPLPFVAAFDAAGNLTEAIPCGDPSRDLRGTRVPDRTVHLGVVAEGTAHHSGDSDEELSAGPVWDGWIGAVRVASTIDRSGRSSSRIELLDGTPLATDLDGAEGLVVDALQRMMGMATAPAGFGIEPLLTVLWLEAIRAEMSDGLRPARWYELARLHPAVLTADEGPFDDLVERCEIVAASSDWESIRTLAALGRAPFGLRSDGNDCLASASWYDSGSFARALLAERRPVGELIRELSRDLPPELSHRVMCTVSPFAGPLVW